MENPSLRAELYLGAAVPGKDASVTKADFVTWLRKAVTFDGYTVQEVDGAWKGTNELTRLLIIYGPNAPTFRAEVRKIAENYGAAFHQESVAYAFIPSIFGLTNQVEALAA